MDDSFQISDFSGGLNSFEAETIVAPNQAVDLLNVNIVGKGVEKRRGNSAWNSTAMVSSATAVTGGFYNVFDNGTGILYAVAGTKVFTDSGLSGTMADKTGTVTITAGVDNVWKGVTLNNKALFFGGAPDAPFTHDGTTGSATTLGGSPPSAYTAFVAANRVFACGTSSNPSTIYWCALKNPADWTSSGSGNADVSKSDGDSLLQGIPVNASQAILFKEHSTHLMILQQELTSFPVFQLQSKIGACGREAIVFVNGVIYFITPAKRMKMTSDGVNFQQAPNYVDDVWDSLNTSRLKHTRGIYYEKLNQIWWFVATGNNTNHDKVIVWDLRNQCWLIHDLVGNIAFLVQGLRLFTGNYDGKLYEQDKALTYTDASNSFGPIDGYWQSKWFSMQDYSELVHPLWITSAFITQSAGSLTLSYGFDYTLGKSDSLSMSSPGGIWDTGLWDDAVWGGQNAVHVRTHTFGRGNVFGFKIRNATSGQNFRYQGAAVRLRKVSGAKEMSLV